MADTTVIFYNNTSSNLVINKTITQLASVSCKLKEPVDIERPELYVAYDNTILKANYMYIADFGRYYYCHAEGERGANLRIIADNSDPLMSFAAAIKAAPAVVARNPWHFDMYLPDPKLPVEARAAISTLKFPETAKFDGSHNSYILVTLGSG